MDVVSECAHWVSSLPVFAIALVSQHQHFSSLFGSALQEPALFIYDIIPGGFVAKRHADALYGAGSCTCEGLVGAVAVATGRCFSL